MTPLHARYGAVLVALVLAAGLAGCGTPKPVACPPGVGPISKADNPADYKKYRDSDHDNVVCEAGR